MNPIPVTTCPMTRVMSTEGSPLKCRETSTKTAAPRETRAFVLRPAFLFRISRSIPISNPDKRAAPIRIPYSHKSKVSLKCFIFTCMQKFPIKLDKSLEKRKHDLSFRELHEQHGLIDFSSNDYLGFSASENIFEEAHKILKQNHLVKNGATGSRLLTGNHALYSLAEREIADFFCSEVSLLYNSGYDANLGFFSSVPRRGDVVLYDEFSHASIRDGISLGNARAFKFSHNDFGDLREKVVRVKNGIFEGELFIVTEAVFSMDGDRPDLKKIVDLALEFSCLVVLDEAHSAGVCGASGRGSAFEEHVQDSIFARIVTFGKAFGAHGAAILCSEMLKQYLVNYSRSLIYTTALPPHSVATIMAATRHLQSGGSEEISVLQKKISFFIFQMKILNLQQYFVASRSAIHSCIVPGNENVKRIAAEIRRNGFDVKPILSPTVPEGKERLRICLHSFNSEKDLKEVLSLLSQLIINKRHDE